MINEKINDNQKAQERQVSSIKFLLIQNNFKYILTPKVHIIYFFVYVVSFTLSKNLHFTKSIYMK